MLKVSVIMPVYNGERYLSEAIQSVLNQTFKDFEFIIIDDGSVDNSVKIIESFDDERIVFLKINHKGIVGALNTGLEIAKGEYIIRTDADDVSVPERFEKLIKYMQENKDISICGSWAISINEKNEILGEMKYPPIKDFEIKKYILFHNPFIHPAVIFKRKEIIDVGGYKNFKHNEDYELWTRVLIKKTGHNIPEFLIKYRIHSNQLTNKNNFKMRLIGLYVRILALVRK
jgi:glycosyltransferase involved in cell wall biosynthesis